MNYTKITVPAQDVSAADFSFHTEQDQWCVTQFGYPDVEDTVNHWYMVCGYGKITGFFRNTKHAVAFAMRWA